MAWGRDAATAGDLSFDLYDAAPVPHLLLDSSGVVRGANRAAKRQLHVAGELPGRPFASFVADGSREIFREHICSVLRARAVEHCDIELRGDDGARRWVRVYSDAAPASLCAGRGVFCSLSDVDDLLGLAARGSYAVATVPGVEPARLEAASVDTSPREEEPSWDAAYGVLPGREEVFEARPAHAEPAPAAGGAEQPARVLVVDDEELILSSIVRILVRCGYEVVACKRPDDALQRFLADPGGFDAVISDYRMPGMNGIELSERMLARRPDLVVLLVSGYSEEIDPGFVRALGIRGVLDKPLSAQQFTDLLARIAPCRRRARAC